VGSPVEVVEALVELETEPEVVEPVVEKVKPGIMDVTSPNPVAGTALVVVPSQIAKVGSPIVVTLLDSQLDSAKLAASGVFVALQANHLG
jgi:hypothetical protein